MDWNRVVGNWRPLRGKFKDQWSQLTDSQLDSIAGQRERLVDALQQTYKLSKDEADRQVRDWENSEHRAIAFEEVLRRSGVLV